MAIETIKKEKENKLFKKSDIIIYAIIICFICLCFFSVYIGLKRDKVEKINISFKDIKILEYDFNTGLFNEIDNTYYNIYEISNGYKVIFCFNGEENSNIIEIDTKDRKVTMIYANCSTSKECMMMKIEKVSDSIICVPHSLVIEAQGSSKIKDPELG